MMIYKKSLILVLFLMTLKSSFAIFFEGIAQQEKAEVNVSEHSLFAMEMPGGNVEQVSSFDHESRFSATENISDFDALKEAQRSDYGVGISYRFLGHLSKVGLEKSIMDQVSISGYYGRFQGRYYGSEDKGFISALEHYSLEFNIYLNSQKKVFHSGVMLRFGAHYNYLKPNRDSFSIEIDGEDVIGEGHSKIGPVLGISYLWQWKYVNLSIGPEYFALGKLKSFTPLAIGLGVAF